MSMEHVHLVSHPRRLAAFFLAIASACLPAVALAQVTAQDLIGKAVSGDAQTKDITNAISRFTQRDIDGCRAVLERAKSNEPKLPPPGVMMATLWLSAKQAQPARDELEDTVVKFPGDPEPYLMLGDFAFQERRVTDAGVLFDKAAELTEKFTENSKRKRDFEIRGNAGRAAVAEARADWETAQKFLGKWIELDPDSASAYQRLGIVLFQLGKETDAQVAFREAKKLDEKSVQPEIAMARLYDNAKNYDAAKKKETARKLIEAAMKAAPNDPAVFLEASQWYLRQNDLEAAKAAADGALKIEPTSLEGRIARGVIARVARDYKAAKQFLGEAHIQSPLNFAASNSLALVLIESDDAADRQRALEMAQANAQMAQNSPQQIPAATTLAWVFYKEGRREDAIGILDQIQRNNALSTDGAYYVAKILSDRGERDRARQILEDVLANEAMFATRPDAKDLLEKLKSAK